MAELESVTKRWTRAVVVCLLMGVGYGLVLFAMCWYLQDGIRRIPEIRARMVRLWLTKYEIAFLAVACLAGWIGTYLAERIGHLEEWPQMLGLAASAVLAVGLGLALARAAIAPWSGQFTWLIGFFGAAMLAAPGVKLAKSYF